MAEKGKEVSVYDRLGGNVEEEIKGYPIEDLNLISLMDKNGKKQYPCNFENVSRILSTHPAFIGKFRYNVWLKKEEIKDDDSWRDLEDSDFISIARVLSVTYSFLVMISKHMATESVLSICHQNKYNEAINFIRGLPSWDGLDRIGIWLQKVYGTVDDKYHEAVGSNFFKGLVARILVPGIKFDSVMIIEGDQGCFKTTSLEIIASPKWHLETTMTADSKDFFMQFCGKLIVEFAEGETLGRTGTKKLKAIISTRVDTYRSPFGRMMKDVPRGCVFTMTTNQEEFLKDETGNRRFFPIKVTGKANIQWLKENRDQLYAEALYRFEVLKESIHEYPESAKEYQENKMVTHQHEDRISEWLNSPTRVTLIEKDGITVDEIWSNALMGDIVRLTKRDQMQIGSVLKKLGFEKERLMVNGVRMVRWLKTRCGNF